MGRLLSAWRRAITGSNYTESSLRPKLDYQSADVMSQETASSTNQFTLLALMILDLQRLALAHLRLRYSQVSSPTHAACRQLHTKGRYKVQHFEHRLMWFWSDYPLWTMGKQIRTLVPPGTTPCTWCSWGHQAMIHLKVALRPLWLTPCMLFK